MAERIRCRDCQRCPPESTWRMGADGVRRTTYGCGEDGTVSNLNVDIEWSCSGFRLSTECDPLTFAEAFKSGECNHAFVNVGMDSMRWINWCTKCGAIHKSNGREAERKPAYASVWQLRGRTNPKYPRSWLIAGKEMGDAGAVGETTDTREPHDEDDAVR